jgi:ribosomal-protein-serine acetyltransferase
MVFPETIETERLVLRRYTSADAAGILELVEQNRGMLTREFPQMAKELIGVEEAESFVEEKLQQGMSRKTFCYGIWRKSSNEQIGQILAKNIAWEIPAAELGYFIGSAWQRRGSASESIAALLRVAFQELEFQRIFVRILPSNKESLSLAKKLGFQEEGLHRNAFRCGFGELHDVRYLSMTAEDYRLRMKAKMEIRN